MHLYLLPSVRFTLAMSILQGRKKLQKSNHISQSSIISFSSHGVHGCEVERETVHVALQGLQCGVPAPVPRGAEFQPLRFPVGAVQDPLFRLKLAISRRRRIWYNIRPIAKLFSI